MLYLSRGEQLALALLVVLLLGGAGVLTYRQGVAAGRAQVEAPLFVEAPAPREAPQGEAPALPAAWSAPQSPAPATRLPSEPSRPHPAAAKAPPVSRIISLNRATLEQLDSLPGIGPVYARRIIERREQLRRERGDGYRSVDELLDVPGIGPKRLGAIRDLVTP